MDINLLLYALYIRRYEVNPVLVPEKLHGENMNKVSVVIKETPNVNNQR